MQNCHVTKSNQPDQSIEIVLQGKTPSSLPTEPQVHCLWNYEFVAMELRVRCDGTFS